jgi:endonuclease
MRLIVAPCEVTYSGRLNAFLPESTRLLMVKEDGGRAGPRGRRWI